MFKNRNFILALIAIGVLFTAISATSLVEFVNADEIKLIQSVYEGRLDWYTSAGLKWQGFGTVYTYPKRSIYEFNDNKIRFNDGGHATMIGSMQYKYPLDKASLTRIHTEFGSEEAVAANLVQKVVDRCIYMTGPLMSSKESYAEKRNELLSNIENQVKFGIFETSSKEIRILDPITGIEKTKTQVTITTINGMKQYQGTSILTDFGLAPDNFAIERLVYDQTVEDQIKQQQQITMDVQTAIADAKKAEQKTLTVVENGKANAAEAKWEQEKLKATAVTLAEQQLEVATLDAKSAFQYKKAKILRAEGDAAYKKKVMEADGALAQKLETYEKVSQMYANAMANYKGNWVPQYMGGGGQNGTGNGATAFMEILTVNAMKQLSLDMSMKANEKP